MIRPVVLACLLSIPPCLSSDAIAGACKDAWLNCDVQAFNALSTPDPSAQQDCNALHTNIHLEFDHVAGTARVDAQSVSGHWPRAVLLDDFVLTGPPAGTVVPITVVGDFELVNIRQENHVTWSAGQIFIPYFPGAPDPNVDETFFTATAPGTETATRQVRLTFDMKAGQAYEIQLSPAVFTSGNAGGSAHGRLSFEGLPQGSSITSCKGFRQDQPVPALPLSWGAVKASYR